MSDSRRTLRIFVLLLGFSLPLHAQNIPPGGGMPIIPIPAPLQSKVASGRLLKDARRFIDAGARVRGGSARMNVIVYFAEFPSDARRAYLNGKGLLCHPETWTPPMDNHPLGFLLAECSADRIAEILAIDDVKKMESAEGLSLPRNNAAAKAIRAPAVWSKGWSGAGIKVGVLDSGIDSSYFGNELPAGTYVKDYSLFPAVDTDVRNHITGHGTHVAGTILGRGSLSASNTANGGGSYKGIAPAADLAFFKIGDDTTANATDAAIIAAMQDAVDVQHVRLISMSYGGWGAYHDGSEPIEQKTDWCFTQGVPVILAAGNDAGAARHYKGTVAGAGESDFIKVNINGAGQDKTRPSFNLVWYDGPGIQTELRLKYYDANKNEITQIYRATTSESPRGTQSQYSSLASWAPAGNSTLYLKVVNYSNMDLTFHIYEDWDNPWDYGHVKFDQPDRNYTVGSPSYADHALSIAAYTSRSFFVNAQGGMRQYSQTLDQLASFSSRGPRVDGAAKPDIAAPGSALISLRDRDIFTTPDAGWVDDDGVSGGAADYYVMQGTSMATPTCAGAAVLVLQKYPSLTPQQLYDSLRLHARADLLTGALPNTDWGAGKLDVGFLAGLSDTARSGGWILTTQTGGTNPNLPSIAVNGQGTLFAAIGKPYSNDTSRIFRSADLGQTWAPTKAERGLLPLVALNNGVLLTAGRFGGLLYRSSTGGDTWTEQGSPLDYTSFAAGPGDSIVIAGTYGEGVYASSDAGVTWGPLADGLPPSAQVPIVAAGRNGWLYAGVKIGNVIRLHRCRRGDNLWLPAESGIDTTKNINAVCATPDGAVYAVVYDRVYRSDDDGATWQQLAILNSYLQNVYAWSDATIFVETVSAGIYRSTDRGVTWSSFNDGLLTANMVAMGSNRQNWLYASASEKYLYRRALATLPGAPILQSPQNNATAPIACTLQWQPLPEAAGYRVQVSTRGDFATPIADVDGIRSGSWTMGNLEPMTLYYWRAAASNDAGTGPWSAVWTFTTAQIPPEAPILLEPADGTVDVPLDAAVKWQSGARAATYSLQIAIDSLFASVIREQTGITGTSFAPGGLDGLTRYFWRVRAVNSGGPSPWSTAWSFTTLLTIPAAPSLLQPPDGASNVPPGTVFHWTAPTGTGLSYRLQISRSPDFLPAQFDSAAIAPTTCSFPILNAFTKYYWRVSAANQAGAGPWSAVWSFITSPPPPPQAPLLVSPIAGAKDVPIPPTLRWNRSATATSYAYQIGADALFMPPLIDSRTISDTVALSSNLQYNATYYWRVNAQNPGGGSPWSEVRSFTTGPLVSVKEAVPATGVRITGVFPEPANDAATVECSLPAGERVDLRLYNRFGVLAARRPSDPVSPGFIREQFDVGHLPSGLYCLILRSASGSSIRKLLILH